MYVTKIAGAARLLGQKSISPTVTQLKNSFYSYSPEPSQPLNREPKYVSVEDAVKCVKSGKLLLF